MPEWQHNEMLIIRTVEKAIVVFPIRGEMIDPLGRKARAPVSAARFVGDIK